MTTNAASTPAFDASIALATNDALHNAVSGDLACSAIFDDGWVLQINSTQEEIHRGTIDEIREMINLHELRMTF